MTRPYRAVRRCLFPDREDVRLEEVGHRRAHRGDTYASFGRGLALNIVKNTDIDVDTSIRGAKGIFRTGDFDLTAISGITNQQQISQENPNVAIAPNVDHMVSGVRAEWFGPVNLGAHAVAYKFARPTEIPLAVSATRYSSDLDVGIVGANVEANGVLGLDIYGEYALYDYQAEDMTDGNGRLRVGHMVPSRRTLARPWCCSRPRRARTLSV